MGRHFARLHALDGLRLWYWSRALLALYQAGLAGRGERLTQVEIGIRVGRAAREEEYSKAWVSQVLKAARQWPRRPQSIREWFGFLGVLHGHHGTGGAWRLTLKAALGRVGRAAKVALHLGGRPADIRRELERALAAVPVGEAVPPGTPPAASTTDQVRADA